MGNILFWMMLREDTDVEREKQTEKSGRKSYNAMSHDDDNDGDDDNVEIRMLHGKV